MSQYEWIHFALDLLHNVDNYLVLIYIDVHINKFSNTILKSTFVVNDRWLQLYVS